MSGGTRPSSPTSKMGQTGERGVSTPRRSTLVEPFSAAVTSRWLMPLETGAKGGRQGGQRGQRPGDAGQAGLEVRHALTSSRCGGVGGGRRTSWGRNAQYRTNRQTIPPGATGRMRLAAATDRERNL